MVFLLFNLYVCLFYIMQCNIIELILIHLRSCKKNINLLNYAKATGFAGSCILLGLLFSRQKLVKIGSFHSHFPQKHMQSIL